MESKKIRKLRELLEAGKLSEADYFMWLNVYMGEGRPK